MQPGKMKKLIHRKTKNVNILLKQSEKNTPQKICTLMILGVHAIARWSSRQNFAAAAIWNEMIAQQQGRAN